MDKRKEATDKDHDRFVECHRLMLLRYLDGKAGRSGKELDALGYIDSVLAEWQEAFSNSELTGPSPEERTFWFAFYLLEDLVENPGVKVKSGVSAVSSSGNLIGLCHFNSIFEFDSSDQFAKVIETA